MRTGRPRSAEADEAILAAALECFAERGVDGLTVDEVAARAGVGKATIYRRYPGKVDLVIAALEAGRREQLPHVDTGRLETDLRAFLGHLMRAMREPAGGAVMRKLAAEIDRDPEFAAAHRALVARRREETEQIIRRAIDRGEVRPDVDPGVAIDLIVGPLSHRVLLTGDRVDDAFLDAVVAAVVRALAPDATRGRQASRPGTTG